MLGLGFVSAGAAQNRLRLSARPPRLTRTPVSRRPAITFSPIDMAGKGLGFWKTIPIRFLVSVTRVPAA